MKGFDPLQMLTTVVKSENWTLNLHSFISSMKLNMYLSALYEIIHKSDKTIILYAMVQKFRVCKITKKEKII